jgi:hypothetical protein
MLQDHSIDAGRWLLRALDIFAKFRDQHRFRKALSYFQDVFRSASPTDRATLKAQWKAAGLPASELPSDVPPA